MLLIYRIFHVVSIISKVVTKQLLTNIVDSYGRGERNHN